MSKSDPIEILLADDDPVVRAGYAKKVRSHGWSLTLAADGFEALQAVRNGEFDVLLLDLKMPYRNGADVLRILRTEGTLRETRVFLLAEPGDSELVEQAMREGADGVFDKSQMGPRDVISELQVMFHGIGRARRVGKPVGENVPDDVAKLANRFRKGGSPGGGSPLHTQTDLAHGRSLGNSMGGSMGGSMGASMGASMAPGLGGSPHGHGHGHGHGGHMGNGLHPPPQPNLGHGNLTAHHSRMPSPPTAYGTRRADGPMPGAHGTHHGSYDNYAPSYAPPEPPPPPPPPPPAPAPHPGHGHPQGFNPHAPGPPTAEPLPNEPSFDTVLNKMVGEAGRLASYMGLPQDFSCPVCRNTLILRLWPEPGQEATVVGHFFCPGCTRT